MESIKSAQKNYESANYQVLRSLLAALEMRFMNCETLLFATIFCVEAGGVRTGEVLEALDIAIFLKNSRTCSELCIGKSSNRINERLVGVHCGVHSFGVA